MILYPLHVWPFSSWQPVFSRTRAPQPASSLYTSRTQANNALFFTVSLKTTKWRDDRERHVCTCKVLRSSWRWTMLWTTCCRRNTMGTSAQGQGRTCPTVRPQIRPPPQHTASCLRVNSFELKAPKGVSRYGQPRKTDKTKQSNCAVWEGHQHPLKCITNDWHKMAYTPMSQNKVQKQRTQIQYMIHK